MSQLLTDSRTGTDAVAPLLDALAAVAGRGDTPDPALLARVIGARPQLSALAVAPAPGRPYSRSILHADDRVEIMLARWRPGHGCAPHDHGGSGGFVVAVEGGFDERRFGWDGPDLLPVHRIHRPPGGIIPITPEVIHDMTAVGDGAVGTPPACGGRSDEEETAQTATAGAGLTLHVYSPPPPRMRVFDLEGAEALDLVGDYGAWLPDGDHPRIPFRRIAPKYAVGPVIWIGYTTAYRGGSAEFAAAAATMARELGAAHPDARVLVAGLHHKADFTAELARLADAGQVIDQLHLISHAGMYGPMFGSTDWPEQFSPHEWRAMSIPFAADGRAYFHACRTARWFAPFFAETFGVTAFGNQNYTTVSAHKDHFSWAGRQPGTRPNLYLIATPGRKSHGVAGSVRKYLGSPADPMIESRPAATAPERSYDRVAERYDRAYADIRVRDAEWRWVAARASRARADLGRGLRVLDIGCGNGALLRALDDHGDLESGIGVDASMAMLARAVERQRDATRLRFAHVDSPVLELPDDSVDVVVSFLSFRYLDWDPIMAEIRRVLAPGGRLWVVDMVEHPARAAEVGVLARSAAAHWRTPRCRPVFAANLAELTSHPDWQDMLAHNPIRAEHEYRWYFASRFPGRRLRVLTATLHQRVVAFDSGPLAKGRTEPLSYP